MDIEARHVDKPSRVIYILRFALTIGICNVQSVLDFNNTALAV
jgi:hypothetical protein